MANNTRLSEETLALIKDLLIREEKDGFYYGLFTSEQFDYIAGELAPMADWLQNNVKPETSGQRFSEKDVLCISYIDHIQDKTGEYAAKRLADFFNSHLADFYSHLHILPHFPSPLIHPELEGPASRADGGFEAFSYKMDERHGDSASLKKINAGLMLDFVLNHLSAKGEWFKKFLEDDPEYKDFFVHIPEDRMEKLDTSGVFRPRPHHPVIPFTGKNGKTKNVWCTFSSTQVDLNVKNPKVFVRLMEALVKDFIGQGAIWVRLDAVGYLVKMLGIEEGERKSSCFGIEETHNILKAINLFLKDVAPEITLVPEVNAPGDVIATYYGENNDEGHMVYDFPSAPISLYTIYSGDAGPVIKWAQNHTRNPDKIGLAFTSSHDGIGVLPMSEVEPMKDGRSALDFLIEQVETRNGKINYKAKVIDGKQVTVPYEACITWLQAVLTPEERAGIANNTLSEEQIEVAAKRFMASQSFVFTAPHCVPADYIGAVACLLNDEETFKATDHARNKNRGLIDRKQFEKCLADPQTAYEVLANRIYYLKKQMIEARRSNPAFSPYAKCKVDIVETGGTGEPVYSVLRQSPNRDQTIIAMTNCTHEHRRIEIAEGFIPGMKDLFTGMDYKSPALELAPYQVAWLVGK